MDYSFEDSGDLSIVVSSPREDSYSSPFQSCPKVTASEPNKHISFSEILHAELLATSERLRPKFRSDHGGISLSNVTIQGRLYENCFIGKQAVTWIVQEVFFPLIPFLRMFLIYFRLFSFSFFLNFFLHLGGGYSASPRCPDRTHMGKARRFFPYRQTSPIRRQLSLLHSEPTLTHDRPRDKAA
jgi:hypothetical protein